MNDRNTRQESALTMPWLVGLGLGALALIGYFTHGFGLLPPPAKGPVDTPALVRRGEQIFVPETSALRQKLTLASADLRPTNGKIMLPGVVEADPSRVANVLSPLSGRLVGLKASLGDRVTKGQVLAVIDSPDLAQAYDDFDKAADSEKLTKRNLDRQMAQFKIGAISERDRDQAVSDHDQAQAELTRTITRLSVIGVDPKARAADRKIKVRAPSAGSITQIAVAEGNMINDPTQALMTLADLSRVFVTAQAAEKDLAAISKDQAALISLIAYPGEVMPGRVSFVSDIVEPDTRRTKIRISFDNAKHLLKPNMFGTVTLDGPVVDQVVLPTSALLINNERTTVFVAVTPWTFVRREVEAAFEEGTSIQIRSGLKAGDQVVVKGGVFLND
jgi:cobalt-zinc-cadmium efflux system membrane fusion protein